MIPSVNRTDAPAPATGPDDVVTSLVVRGDAVIALLNPHAVTHEAGAPLRLAG